MSNSEVRALLQRKICLSEDSPEPVYDLSGCQLTRVPSSVYAKCQVLLKRQLWLHNNCLQRLDSDDSSCVSSWKLLSSVLQLLRLDNNQLTKLPRSLCHLQQLQVLDVSRNCIRELPAEVWRLPHLHTLLCSHNRLRSVPAGNEAGGGGGVALRHLDLSWNRLRGRLSPLVNASRMTELLLEGNADLTWPPQSVIELGSEAVLQLMCQEAGWERVSQCELQSSAGACHVAPQTPLDSQWSDKSAGLQQLEKLNERSKQLEQSVLLTQQRQRQHFVASLSQQQHCFDAQLTEATRQRQTERDHFLTHLRRLERAADTAVARAAAALSARLANPAAVAAQLHTDQQRLQQLVDQSLHTEALRKHEVCQSMLQLMQERFVSEQLLTSMQHKRHDLVKHTELRDTELDAKLGELFRWRDAEHQSRLQSLQHDEQLQREAFHSLFVEQDAGRRAIIGQMAEAEQALARLTALEETLRQHQNNTEMERLAEKRCQLAAMLSQLVTERDRREQQLRLTLKQLDSDRQQQSQHYWLIQFQKLMDNKPAEIRSAEDEMDPKVRSLLVACGLEVYSAHFATAQVTHKALLLMTDSDLQRVGVSNSDARQKLLSHIADTAPSIGTNSPHLSSHKTAETACEVSQHPSSSSSSASAAAASHSSPVGSSQQSDGVACVASAPAVETLLHMELQCCICLERQPEVVFLACGHACSCRQCCRQLTLCPMCRQPIEHTLLMSQPTGS